MLKITIHAVFQCINFQIPLKIFISSLDWKTVSILELLRHRYSSYGTKIILIAYLQISNTNYFCLIGNYNFYRKITSYEKENMIKRACFLFMPVTYIFHRKGLTQPYPCTQKWSKYFKYLNEWLMHQGIIQNTLTSICFLLYNCICITFRAPLVEDTFKKHDYAMQWKFKATTLCSIASLYYKYFRAEAT